MIYLKAGSNATYTPSDIVDELLNLICKTLDQRWVTELSPAWGQDG